MAKLGGRLGPFHGLLYRPGRRSPTWVKIKRKLPAVPEK